MVVGIILKAANDTNNTLCSTGLGAFGQSESSSVHHQCLLADVGSTVGEWALILGVLATIGGVANLIFLSKNQGTRRASASTQSTHFAGASTLHRTAMDGLGARSQPMPRLPAMSWNLVLEAANHLPPPRNEHTRISIRELSNKRDLRAWCFAVDKEGKTSMLALFDNEMLRVSCTDRGASTYFDNPHAGAVVRLYKDEHGQTVKL